MPPTTVHEHIHVCMLGSMSVTCRKVGRSYGYSGSLRKRKLTVTIWPKMLKVVLNITHSPYNDTNFYLKRYTASWSAKNHFWINSAFLYFSWPLEMTSLTVIAKFKTVGLECKRIFNKQNWVFDDSLKHCPRYDLHGYYPFVHKRLDNETYI